MTQMSTHPNYHVIEAILNEDAIGGAKLVGKEDIYAIEDIVDFDKENDLAIVKVREVNGTGIDVPALPLGDSDVVQIGEKIYVAGNPKGLEGTFSDGIISAIRGGRRDKVFQMTAPISPGSSGGPVLNNSGEVIGISVGGMEHGQNLNFAIPVNYLKPMVITPITPDPVSADGALKYVEISKGINPKRSIGIPGTIVKGYSWVFENQDYTALIATDAKWYNQTRGYKRQKQRQYNFYYLPPIVREGTKALQDLIREFNRIMPRTWNAERKVNFVLGFVHALPYTPDDVTTGYDEYYKYAIETLVEGGGDCEDTSVLFASLLSGLNFKVALIWLPGHIAVGVKGNFRGTFFTYENNKYYYCETTATSLKLGDGLEGYDGLYHIMPIASTPIEPKPVKPQINPPKPKPPDPPSPRDTLEKGIKLYEQARYNEAIKTLSSIVRELEDPEQQAQAYLYLGCSKRGFGEGNDKVREQFQESIRHNPNQKLPLRVGKDHPIFAELLEEVRKELTGELTVISLLPQTEIWIFGTGTDRKMLGTGIVSSRLLKGNYIVEGIYAGESRRKTVAIEPDRHEVLDLEIPPIVEHDSPSRISVGERIPLTLNLISSKAPQQVKIYYTIYDRDSNELAQQNQEMRLWDKESTSSTWIYKLGLPAQKYGGLIKYHIEVEYENHLTFRQPETQYSHYQISIVDDKPPTISLLYPPEGAKFGAHQEITIRAEVIDNIAVKDVHIHASSFNSQESQKLSAESSSDIYTIDITVRNIVVLRYYLTATDEAGNESRYPKTGKLKITVTEEPDDKTPPIIRLIKPHDGAIFKVNQRITIEAKVTDDTSVEQVRLFYSFSPSNHLIEPSRYSDRSLTETSSGTYTGHIPPQSKAGYIWYYLTATDGRNESKSEVRRLEIKTIPPPPPLPIYQGIWVSVSADDTSTSDWDGSYMFRFAYLREGKTHPTLGAQLDFSYLDRTNVSAMVQWGPPALGKSNIAFTLLGGIAEYENFLATGTAARSTHMTPILGAGLKFYPRDKIAIDATSSIKFRSDYDTTGLYHYEIGVRFYITRELNLRVGYGKLYLGNRNFTTIQVGLGYTF